MGAVLVEEATRKRVMKGFLCYQITYFENIIKFITDNNFSTRWTGILEREIWTILLASEQTFPEAPLDVISDKNLQ